MLFVSLGCLKKGAEPDQLVQQLASDFLKQPFIPIRAAGALRDDQGQRMGMMMIFEAEDRTTAEVLVGNSPFLRAGLYGERHLLEYQNEVG